MLVTYLSLISLLSTGKLSDSYAAAGFVNTTSLDTFTSGAKGKVYHSDRTRPQDMARLSVSLEVFNTSEPATQAFKNRNRYNSSIKPTPDSLLKLKLADQVGGDISSYPDGISIVFAQGKLFGKVKIEYKATRANNKFVFANKNIARDRAWITSFVKSIAKEPIDNLVKIMEKTARQQNATNFLLLWNQNPFLLEEG